MFFFSASGISVSSASLCNCNLIVKADRWLYNVGKKCCIILCLCSGRAFFFSSLTALPADCRQAETSLNFLLYNQLRHPVSWSGYACQEAQEFLEMFLGKWLSGIQAAHHRNLSHHPMNKVLYFQSSISFYNLAGWVTLPWRFSKADTERL